MSNWQADLAASAAAVRFEDLTAPVLDRLRLLLLHDIAYGLDAVERPAARAARSLAPLWGSGEHRIFGGGESGLLGAVFVNGTCMAASIQEDAWNGQHLGGALIPPALALSVWRGLSTTEMFAALTAGYGAAMVAARRWGAASGARGFRGTAIYGQIGAAVVAAKLLGLGAEGISRAMAVAANTPGGVPGPLLAGTDEFLFQSGLAGMKGTLGALAAREPIAVVADAFDGRAMFGAAYAGQDPAAVQVPPVPTSAELAGLVLEVGLRSYPLNHLCVAPVAAVLNATGGQPTDPAGVTAISVWMPADEAKVVSGAGPFSRPMQAMFSAPLAVAAALRDGYQTVDSLKAGAVDPAVLALAGRVTVHPTEGMAPMTSRVTVESATAGMLSGSALDGDDEHRPSFGVGAERLRKRIPLAPERVAALTEVIGSLPAQHGALERLMAALG